jgi:hypothetical protein
MWTQAKSYRPELHYMRGPGPRWREKHGAPPSPTPEQRLELPYSIWLIPAATLALLVTVTALALA